MTRPYHCPKCGATLEYGPQLDCVTGQREWACDECNIIYSSLEVGQ